MHQLHCIAPTADLLASLRPKQMGVQCAVTDDAVEIFLHGIIGDEYTETDSLSVGRILAANRGDALSKQILELYTMSDWIETILKQRGE